MQAFHLYYYDCRNSTQTTYTTAAATAKTKINKIK